MNTVTVQIGGKTGYGIHEAGVLVGRLFAKMGYNIYIMEDYPSIIKGGYEFIKIRAAKEKIGAHKDHIDLLLAMNQDAISRSKDNISKETKIIYNSDKVDNEEGLGLPLKSIIKEESTSGKELYIMIGALAKTLDLQWDLVDEVLKKHDGKDLENKLKAVKRGYESAEKGEPLKNQEDNKVLPVINGSHAISIGLLKAGLNALVGYPMTPTSPVLEFMAKYEKDLGIHVVLPESEIAVIMMALGYSYMGKRSAVATSGGGFSLMVEAIGLAAQAELPIVVVMGQRSGPSTGMPTYTAQTDLNFVQYASQGEFPRLIVAPGDAEEGVYWSGIALNKAWEYQIPAFVLTDKTHCLGYYSYDEKSIPKVKVEEGLLWDGKGTYKRYAKTEGGISPLAFPPLKDQVVKATGYVHDEAGITTENPDIAKGIADKRSKKKLKLIEDMKSYETVKTYGEGKTALLCWGSNKGVCMEASKLLGIKTIQVVMISPFPKEALAKALEGVEQLIDVECNSEGQLAILVKQYGFKVDETVLKYDGRSISVENLVEEVKKVIK